MAHAFRCDNCGELKEGDPEDIREYPTGDLVVGIKIGKKPPAKAEPDDIERMDLPTGDDFLSFLARRSLDRDDTKAVAADVCNACFDGIVRSAVREATLA